jgi:hypothetical protein
MCCRRLLTLALCAACSRFRGFTLVRPRLPGLLRAAARLILEIALLTSEIALLTLGMSSRRAG